MSWIARPELQRLTTQQLCHSKCVSSLHAVQPDHAAHVSRRGYPDSRRRHRRVQSPFEEDPFFLLQTRRIRRHSGLCGSHAMEACQIFGEASLSMTIAEPPSYGHAFMTITAGAYNKASPYDREVDAVNRRRDGTIKKTCCSLYYNNNDVFFIVVYYSG